MKVTVPAVEIYALEKGGTVYLDYKGLAQMLRDTETDSQTVSIVAQYFADYITELAENHLE